MNLFKTKINQTEFVSLIYQIGYDRYNFLKDQFTNEINYKDALLFVVTETVNSLLTKRIYKYQNIFYDFDIADEVNKIVNSAFQNEEDKANMILYYTYIKDEIWQIIDCDNADMVLELANYFINEITDNINRTDIAKSYMINIFTEWHFELKSILKSIKLQLK